MSKVDTKSLAYAAILLAICILSQFLKNTSVYITGSVINTCLILAVLFVGLKYSVALSVITPVTSFIITGSPIMSAIPLIIPCVMLGNIVLVLSVYFLKNKPSEKIGLPLSIIVGAILKGVFMGVVIAWIIIPNLIPEALAGKQVVFQTMFSVTQLITAAIGGVFAYIINFPLKKSLKK